MYYTLKKLFIFHNFLLKKVELPKFSIFYMFRPCLGYVKDLLSS